MDNTNTQAWEAEKYVQLAYSGGYEVRVKEANTPWSKNVDELHKRNTHGVPKDAIEKMVNRFQDDKTFKTYLKLKEKTNG